MLEGTTQSSTNVQSHAPLPILHHPDSTIAGAQASVPDMPSVTAPHCTARPRACPHTQVRSRWREEKLTHHRRPEERA